MQTTHGHTYKRGPALIEAQIQQAGADLAEAQAAQELAREEAEALAQMDAWEGAELMWLNDLETGARRVTRQGDTWVVNG